MQDIVQREAMMKYISLSVMVVHAQWDETKSKWILRLKEMKERGREWEEETDVFLNGTGFLK